MSNGNASTPVSKSPFWRFSVKFYGVPGVAEACIALQDQAKVDVNILFFLLWNATEKRALNAENVAEVERAIGGWREMAVVPIRNVRRALKSPPSAMAPAVAEGFRTRIKAVELEAERLQQEALYDLAQSGRLGQLVGSAVEAARISVSAYQGVLGPFPPGPLDTLLSAFAAFKMPASDGA
jgi:uncharacterized protein (TIGR02444 family)